MKSEITNENNFKMKLKEKASENSIELDDEMFEKLEIYKNLIIEWNEKINLTAITDEDEIILKHFVDSLECVKHIGEGTIIIDVGTGAGFPGIVIAIYFKGKVKITLLDALNKRLIFLEEVKTKLNLKNINIVHGRAEEVANTQNFREKYDIALARAVAALNILLEYITPYIKIKGKALLMKGDNVKEEISNSKNALKTLNCSISNEFNYELNSENEVFNRSIIEVKKDGSTPNKYPRNYGKIKKQPL